MGIMDVLPTIDMKETPFPYSKLREACKQWGCFRVSNHRLPKTLMSEMRALSTTLLDFPLEIKKTTTCPGPGDGYIGTETVGNLRYESYGITPTAMETFCSHLGLSSLQRAMFEEYYGLTKELIDDIAKKLVTSLEVGEKDLFKDWFCHMKLIKYNFTPETAIGATGIGSHTDPGFFTVLQDDQLVSGLEVLHLGSFVPIEPSSAGNLLIVIGDMGVAWSNGRFINPKHRILCREPSVRITIATFFEGPNDTDEEVEAPQELLSKDLRRLYRPIKYHEYAHIRFAQKMARANGEALAFFRL